MNRRVAALGMEREPDILQSHEETPVAAVFPVCEMHCSIVTLTLTEAYQHLFSWSKLCKPNFGPCSLLICLCWPEGALWLANMLDDSYWELRPHSLGWHTKKDFDRSGV